MRQRRKWLIGLVVLVALALWLLSLNAAQRGIEAQATAEQAASDWCATNVIVECPYECGPNPTAIARAGTSVAPVPTECRLVCPPPTLSAGECEFYYAVEQERLATLSSRGTATP